MPWYVGMTAIATKTPTAEREIIFRNIVLEKENDFNIKYIDFLSKL